jgi:dihydropteroate synthase
LSLHFYEEFRLLMGPKITLLPVATLLQSRGRLLSLEAPLIMGILNVTPDSFFAGSRKATIGEIVTTAGEMLAAGATILDVGGASSKPGAKVISAFEEETRVVPAIRAIGKAFPQAWISIDTFHASVAAAAVLAGAHIVNDISGGQLDAAMLHTVAQMQVPFIAMHMQGTPQTMQLAPHYENVVLEVLERLYDRLAACRQVGIKDVILDVGFGFGKTTDHNYELLRNGAAFRALGCPLLAGLSRKGMVWKPLGIRPEGALNGTTALHMLALLEGASILRVHDVPEAVEAIKLFRLYNHS